MIARSILVDRLAAVAPALGTSKVGIPMLSNLAFDGKKVIAYNDRIGLSSPLNSNGFKGAVPGQTLLDLLPTSIAEEVEISESNGQVRLAASDLSIDLPTVPLDSYQNVFQMPAAPKGEALAKKDAAKLLTAIQACLRSVNDKPVQVADEQGITVTPKGDQLLFYATDRTTISYAWIKSPLAAKFKQTIILSGEFCRQMLRLGREAEQVTLTLKSDHTLFQADETLLFGRVFEPSGQLDFPAVIKRVWPAALREHMIDVPEGFDRVVTRFKLLGDETATSVHIEGGEAVFESFPPLGETVVSNLAMENHPDVSLSIKGGLLQNGFDGCKKVLFTERCAILSGSGSCFFVASHDRS